LQHGFTLFLDVLELIIGLLGLAKAFVIKALRSSIIFTIAGNPNFQRIKKTMTKTSVIQKSNPPSGINKSILTG